MPRGRKQENEFPSHDSFLDIVANMVGILIILVMVTGVRVKNTPIRAPISDQVNRPTAAGLEKHVATERSLQNDLLGIENEIRAVQQDSQLRLAERAFLATMVSAMEQKIQLRRQQLSADEQKDFDLRRNINQAEAELARLIHQQALAETVRAEPIQVESYPTPLSETVDGEEIHFQLHGGLIAAIPLEKLVDKVKQDAKRQIYKLRDLPELTNTVGPLGGFRLRYTMRRYDIPPEVAIRSGQGGSIVRLQRWDLVPVTSQLGESLQAALAERSEFRRTLAGYRPHHTTVTIWTYPDSFKQFRRLKKELFHLGFATAGRPLPDGMPIAASPSGTKSAAQ